MTDALKPCPFCGGRAKLHPSCFGMKDDRCEIECVGCGMATGLRDMPDAITAWNRRADMPVRVKPLVWVPDGGTHQSANSLGLHYGLAQANDGNWVVDLGHSLPLFPDIDLAKAAVQAHHESRIRAALEE